MSSSYMLIRESGGMDAGPGSAANCMLYDQRLSLVSSDFLLIFKDPFNSKILGFHLIHLNAQFFKWAFLICEEFIVVYKKGKILEMVSVYNHAGITQSCKQIPITGGFQFQSS